MLFPKFIGAHSHDVRYTLSHWQKVWHPIYVRTLQTHPAPMAFSAFSHRHDDMPHTSVFHNLILASSHDIRDLSTRTLAPHIQPYFENFSSPLQGHKSHISRQSGNPHTSIFLKHDLHQWHSSHTRDKHSSHTIVTNSRDGHSSNSRHRTFL